MIGLCTSRTRSSRRCASSTARRPTSNWIGRDHASAEHALATYNPVRRHDVTLFILDPGDRIALIRKPHFADGHLASARRRHQARRGLRGRRRARGARRDRPAGHARPLPRRRRRASFTLRAATCRLAHARLPRRARTDTELAPQDADEIAGARWGTLDELAGPLRERLLATGHALWRYRVALHDAALERLLRAC